MLHHTLVDMFRRTPLLLYLLEAQQGFTPLIAAARALPAALTLPAPGKQPARETPVLPPAGETTCTRFP